MKITKPKVIIFGLILIGLLIHISMLSFPLYDDAAAMGMVLTSAKYSPSLILLTYSHFISGFIFYIITTNIFGINDYAIRIIPVLFNLLSFVLIYKFSKLIYNSSVAKISLLLCLFTFFPFFTGTIVDLDGSLIVFFSLLSYYSLYNYFKLKMNKKWLFLFLISTGILVSFKSRVLVLLFSFVALIFFYTNKSIKKTLRYSAYLGLAVLLSILVNLFIVWAVNPSFFPNFIERLISHNNPEGTIFYFIEKIYSKMFSASSAPALGSKTTELVQGLGSNPLRYTTLLISLTPLFLLLPLFQLLKFSKKDFIFLIWSTTIFFYFVAYPLGVLRVPRYLSTFYPVFVILSSVYIYESFEKQKSIEKWLKPKYFLLFLLALVVSLLLYFKINNDAENYWYFVHSTGPVIKIFYPLILSFFLISFLSFAVYLLLNKLKKSSSMAFFCLFLVFSLTINMFLVLDPLLDRTHSKLLKDITDFSEKNNLKKPIFTWNEDVPYYIDTKKIPIVYLGDKFINTTLNTLGSTEYLPYVDMDRNFTDYLKKGGTVILLNYPSNYYPSLNFTKYNPNCSIIEHKDYKTGSVVFLSC